jgi:hypothetical protein
MIFFEQPSKTTKLSDLPTSELIFEHKTSHEQTKNAKDKNSSQQTFPHMRIAPEYSQLTNT